MQDNNVEDFEKFPSSAGEQSGERELSPDEDDFDLAMGDAPKFAGDKFGEEDIKGNKFGIAKPENEYYGEANQDDFNVDVKDPTDDINDPALSEGGILGGVAVGAAVATVNAVADAISGNLDDADKKDTSEEDEEGGKKKDEEKEDEYDENIAGAAALMNYGLNAAARELGVETVVQKIKSFDASGSDNPIRDLYNHLGVDNPEEMKQVKEEDKVSKSTENEFREGENAPSQNKSIEGAFKAIEDMKELIAEVEGANPKYQGIRDGARAAGKGYFEYAVSKYGKSGLAELFTVLGEQEEAKPQGEGEVSPVVEEESKEKPNGEVADETEQNNVENNQIDKDEKNNFQTTSTEEQKKREIETQEGFNRLVS